MDNIQLIYHCEHDDSLECAEELARLSHYNIQYMNETEIPEAKQFHKNRADAWATLHYWAMMPYSVRHAH